MSALADRHTNLLGYWFHLSIDDHDVIIHGSTFSGREQVWLDGQLLFDTRSFKMKITHAINIDGEIHDLTIGYDSIWDQVRGALSMSVHRDNQLIAAATETISPWTVGSLYAVMTIALAGAAYSTLYL